MEKKHLSGCFSFAIKCSDNSLTMLMQVLKELHNASVAQIFAVKYPIFIEVFMFK